MHWSARLERIICAAAAQRVCPRDVGVDSRLVAKQLDHDGGDRVPRLATGVMFGGLRHRIAQFERGRCFCESLCGEACFLLNPVAELVAGFEEALDTPGEVVDIELISLVGIGDGLAIMLDVAPFAFPCDLDPEPTHPTRLDTSARLHIGGLTSGGPTTLMCEL
jgi:hypothetical protein